ncbi:MAG: zinc ribbon domain-containing protein [Xenococcus sp. (in: cyanobacteria)]
MKRLKKFKLNVILYVVFQKKNKIFLKCRAGFPIFYKLDIKLKRNQSNWAFAELQGYIDYKSILSGSLAVKVPAQLTSQCCPKSGHVSPQNRPNKRLTFTCIACHHTLHSDLVGARNVALRTLLLRPDFESKGRISAVPDVSHEETKAKYLPRYLELRWSADTIPTF